MGNYKTKGINLKSTATGESDKIITIFTREHGKIKTIAKGARKTTSKFGARLDILAYNDLLIGNGKTFDVISQCETIETFYKLRSDLDMLECALHICKLVDGVSQIKIKHENLFDLFANSLFMLKDGIRPDFVKKSFEIKLMDMEGVFPVLDKCVKCGKTVPSNLKSIRFNSGIGGVICYNCSEKNNGSIKVPFSAVQFMINIKNRKNMDTQIKSEVSEALESILRSHLDMHLREEYANT